MTHPEIQAADRRARRRVLWLGAGAVLAGAALLLALPGWLHGWADGLLERPADERLRVARCLAGAGTAAVTLPVAVLAGYFLRLSRHIGRTGRWPPPGMRVLRDTAVLHGPDAKAHARRLRLLGWVYLGCTGAVGLWSWTRLMRLATLLGVA